MLRFLRAISPLLAALGALGLAGGLLLLLWLPSEMRAFTAVTLIAASVMLLLAAIGSLDRIRAAIFGRHRRYVLGGIATTALMVAALILVNLAATRFPLRWDTTASTQFTLSAQSLRVLESLTEPVRVTGFYARSGKTISSAQQRAEDLLAELQRRSSHVVLTYQIVDPDVQPSVARRHGPMTFPSLVFEGMQSGRRHVLTGEQPSEQGLIGALLMVTGARQKTVYVLTGHQERDFRDFESDSQGYGLVARGLTADNYRVLPLNLREQGAFPGDIAVLIVADPRRDLLPDEITLMQDWLTKGGRALFLMEPNPPQSFRRRLAQWGIALRPGMIVDPRNSVSGDPRTPLIGRGQYMRTTSITAGGGIAAPLDVTFFPSAGAVDTTDAVQQSLEAGQKLPASYTNLAFTSPESWLSEDPDRSTFDGTKDIPGPHSLALAVNAIGPVSADASRAAPSIDATPTNSSLVVFGDADFASNRYYAAFSNADFLLNSVNWLSQDDNLISIRPKTITYRRLVVSSLELDFIRYSSWFLLPMFVGGFGIFAWWRRRS